MQRRPGDDDKPRGEDYFEYHVLHTLEADGNALKELDDRVRKLEIEQGKSQGAKGNNWKFWMLIFPVVGGGGMVLLVELIKELAKHLLKKG